MLPYTRAWLWIAFIPERLVSSAGSFPLPPFLVSPLQDPLSLPWSCCSSLAPDERSQWLLHHSRYWHIMRFNPFGKSEARKHLSAWLLIMLPLPRDVVVISLLHGLGCLSSVWTQLHDGRCNSCCLVAAFWMACRKPRNWLIRTTSTGGARRPSAS